MNQSNATGLTHAEAAALLKSVGPNFHTESRFVRLLKTAKPIFLDPLGLMLLVLAAVYASIGHTEGGSYTDSWILLAAYIPVTGVSAALEMSSKNALRALGATLRLKSKVIRSSEITEILTAHVVPGDLLIFEEGATLAADGRVVEAHALSINEAPLTGESEPIDKGVGQFFFAGTTVLTGRGLGIVEKTGPNSSIGKTKALIEKTGDQKSLLHKKILSIIRYASVAALGLTLLLFFIEYARTGKLAESFIIALTFGMSAVPEEFPLVFTLYLGFGAWRLSKRGVLVKSLASVEALGSVDVICTDKTGTLTEGVFQFNELYLHASAQAESLSNDQAWQFALMACETIPIDSMETEIHSNGAAHVGALQDWKLVHDYSFENSGKHMAHVWESGQFRKTAIKGAPEGVLEHCNLSANELEKITAKIDQLATQGKRLLGLAGKVTQKNEEPFINDPKKPFKQNDLIFIGLIVFSDPVRSTAKQAITKCKQLGINVKLLTGDHKITALAVARAVGIIDQSNKNDVYTGSELEKMSPSARIEAFRNGSVFSRVTPEQKYDLIDSLKRSGATVAMTGDGINDAPALKLADIGISMGQAATDVARSAAKMVLMKNDFNGIVAAIFEGRKIFTNLRKSFSYLIAFHIPIFILSLIPPLLGWEPILLPIHIVLLEFLVHPISAFVFENLQRPLHLQKENKLFSREIFFLSSLEGLLLSAFILIFVGFALNNQLFKLNEIRLIAIAFIFFGNLFFIVTECWPQFNFRFYVTLILLVCAGLLFLILAQITGPLQLLAGLMVLAFTGALTCLPIWIYNYFRKPNFKASVG